MIRSASAQAIFNGLVFPVAGERSNYYYENVYRKRPYKNMQRYSERSSIIALKTSFHKNKEWLQM